MTRFASLLFVCCLCANGMIAQHSSDSSKYLQTVPGRWPADKANAWYAQQPWLVGANYLPATAINQIDMWQASTWDPATIDKEMGWAENMGMNTMRVFLHDLVWASDEQGLYRRMDEFLTICQRHGIKPFFVFFDDCHFPAPALGPQPLPVRGYHNSGWVNSPGRAMAIRFADGTINAKDKAQLKGYIQQTMERFKNDERVLFWELYNEPGRGDSEDNIHFTEPMLERSNKLLHATWEWARAVHPSQPITATAIGSEGENNIRINRINSDILSIHNYDTVTKMETVIKDYVRDGRPVLMTEWLARTRGNRVEDVLPLLKQYHIAAVTWGFVSGKSGTVWPWTSRREGGQRISLKEKRAQGIVVKEGEAFPEPAVWFHDLLRVDGTPYNKEEINLFMETTGRGKKKQ